MDAHDALTRLLYWILQLIARASPGCRLDSIMSTPVYRTKQKANFLVFLFYIASVIIERVFNA
jgi:hypothetical protein